MPVQRYRSIEEMPPPWRESGDPANLRMVGELMALHRRLTREPRREPGVTRFRSIEELKAAKEPRPDRQHPVQRRSPGTAPGKVWIAPDFDEPLDDFEDYT